MKSPFNLAFTASLLGAKDTEQASVDQLLGHDYLRPLKELQHRRILDGKPVVDLSMVNPDLAPPRPVIDRLLESVTKSSSHRYSVSRGVRKLREAFADKYDFRFGVALNPETEVCVCLGSKDATFHALRAMIQPGERVIVSAPAYPAHLSAVALVGGVAVEWRAAEEPALAAKTLARLLDETEAKAVLLNFPSNPAGMTVSREWWTEIGRVCAERDAFIVNDFVYGEMCFGGEPGVSALTVREQGARCVEVYSLSKAYNVPGWRVGALVGDERVVKAISRLKSHADYGLFLPLQYAAAFALSSRDDLVHPTSTTYERRIKALIQGLSRLGWECAEPKAGACVWARFPTALGLAAKGESEFVSVRVAEHILSETGVLVAPGRVFGEGFDDRVRFAVVVSEERIRDVVAAMAALTHANSR